MKSEPEATTGDTLGQRIRRQRRALFLTQAGLASLLDVNQSNIARWEKDASVPALRHRLPLAAALMISPHILYASLDDEAVA